jgi:galactose mutarotase-like enzyme
MNRLNNQLFSLMFGEKELIWGGGKPEELKTAEERKGWQNSEIVMLPIVGAAKDNKITVDGKEYPMTQHGIARHLDNDIYEATDRTIGAVQKYKAMTEVKGTKGSCVFPFSYELYKSYMLGDDFLLLRIELKNLSEKPMPYSIAWHPALRTWGDAESFVRTKSGKYPIGMIKGLSKTGALVLEGVNDVEYVSKNGTVDLTSNFGNMQVWSPEEDLICLEPISTLSDREYSGELGQKPGYKILGPGEGAYYWAKIKLSGKGCGEYENK